MKESENIDADGTAAWEKASVLIEYGMISRKTVFGERQRATGNAAEAFGIENAGSIAPGQSATMVVLVKGRPDRDIADSVKLCRYGWQTVVGKRVKQKTYNFNWQMLSIVSINNRKKVR